MHQVRALLLAAALAFAIVTLGGGAAAANGPVNCDPYTGICTVSASSAPRPGSEGASALSPVTSTASRGCRMPTGQAAPCSVPLLGWLNATDGCYYRATAAPPASSPLIGQLGRHPGGSGSYYLRNCLSEVGGRLGTVAYTSSLVWRPAPPAGSPGLPSPAQLARVAVSRLALTGPGVQLAPPAAGVVVGVPVWIWTNPAGWSGRSAAAAVPGESVTATARPVSTVYTLGDGAQVVCTGPGTRWSAQAAQVSPGYRSPTCGYTYSRSSAGAPVGVFALTATTSWQVSWAGGGQSGALSMTTRSAPVRVRVADAEALNTTGSSR